MDEEPRRLSETLDAARNRPEHPRAREAPRPDRDSRPHPGPRHRRQHGDLQPARHRRPAPPAVPRRRPADRDRRRGDRPEGPQGGLLAEVPGAGGREPRDRGRRRVLPERFRIDRAGAAGGALRGAGERRLLRRLGGAPAPRAHLHRRRAEAGRRQRGAPLLWLLAAALRRRPVDPRQEPADRGPPDDRRRRPAGRPALPVPRRPALAAAPGRGQLPEPQGAGAGGGLPAGGGAPEARRLARRRAARPRPHRGGLQGGPAGPARHHLSARRRALERAPGGDHPHDAPGAPRRRRPGAADRLRRRRQPPARRRPVAAARDRRPRRARSRAAPHLRPDPAREPADRLRRRRAGSAPRLLGAAAAGRRQPRRPAAHRRGRPLRPRPRLRPPRHRAGRRPRRPRPRLADPAHRPQELPRRGGARRHRGTARPLGPGAPGDAPDRPRAGAALRRRSPAAQPAAGQRPRPGLRPRRPAVRADHAPRRQVPGGGGAAGLLRGARGARPPAPRGAVGGLDRIPADRRRAAHQADRRRPGAAPRTSSRWSCAWSPAPGTSGPSKPPSWPGTTSIRRSPPTPR